MRLVILLNLVFISLSKNIFLKHTNLRKNCQKYLPDVKIFPKNQTLRTLTSKYRTGLIKLDFTHDLMYCFPAKTGATNWNKLAAAIKRNVSIQEIEDSVHPNDIYSEVNSFAVIAKFYREIEPKASLTNSSKVQAEIDKFLIDNNYPHLKFWAHIFLQNQHNLPKIHHGILVARHPLLRLYSTWAHRFSDISDNHFGFYQTHIQKIRQKYTENTDVPPPKGIFVTLAGFLRYVSRKDHVFDDVHWQRITQRCHPCQLIDYYDMVANTESADSDSLEFLRLLGLSDRLSLPGAYSKLNGNTNSRGPISQDGNSENRIAKIKRYFREFVPKAVIEQVYTEYYHDFVLFGYSLDGFY